MYGVRLKLPMERLLVFLTLLLLLLLSLDADLAVLLAFSSYSLFEYDLEFHNNNKVQVFGLPLQAACLLVRDLAPVL